MMSGELTLHDLVRRRAADTPDAVAVMAPDRRPLSYRALLDQVEATVERLRVLGIERNDRVAIVLPNGPEMAVAFVAVSAAATCAPLNPTYRASEFDYAMTDLGMKALLVAAGVPSSARDVAAMHKIPVFDVTPAPSGEAGAFQLLAEERSPAAATPGFARPTDTALVLHTSGTTSRPKIVPLTHANICASGRSIAASLELTADDRCLNVMPLFHIHGLIGALVASLAAGASVACAPGFDGARFFGWLDACRPTWYTAVPTIHRAVLVSAAAHPDVVARRPLRFIRSCSAALPTTVSTRLEHVFGTQVIEAYGMTEAAHQITSNPLAPRRRKTGSVGVAAGATVAIMGDSARLLPPGETGEVVIRGPGITAGYESNAPANAHALVDGWFRTGDLGHLDDDGYVFLTGRLKEIINRGGEKIAPGEVDEVLVSHPDVVEATAFALPHPTLGEDVAAAVVLREGATAVGDDIRKFAAARLATFKVPQQVVCVPAIPKGPTGKVQRIGLAERLADALEAGRRSAVVSSTDAVEGRLQDIWRRLLTLEQVGVRDNFYVLGGDSLTMSSMVVEVEEHFGTPIALERFLDRPTIETLASMLRDGKVPDAPRSVDTGGRRHMVSDSPLRGLRNRVLQALALYAPGYKTTRVWLHRWRGIAIGRNVSIGLSALLETAYPELVSIGDNVTIGMRAIVIAHLRDRTRGSRADREPTVRIEDDAYIGPGVIILPNVTIGRGAVVSAGSVVSKSVPPWTLVRGNPAEPIASCGVSLAGGVAYEQFVRSLRPLPSTAKAADIESVLPSNDGLRGGAGRRTWDHR
jgi:acyl-CoA synthetase (AMP-forming)/AMP-acid ligase II/acetyltransferase-like isoleucine patch superfamily enzyme/acyl carrier protein